MQELKAKINPDGSLEVETSGFKGASCIAELENFTKEMQALGVSLNLKDQKKKSEYYIQGQRTGISNKTG